MTARCMPPGEAYWRGHRHYFEPIIVRVPAGATPAWEFLAGYKPCECGLTHGRWVMRLALDPAANIRAALRYIEKRYGPLRSGTWHSP